MWWGPTKAINCSVKVDGLVILVGGGGDTWPLFCVIELVWTFWTKRQWKQKPEICPQSSALEHSQYSAFACSLADTCQTYLGWWFYLELVGTPDHYFALSKKTPEICPWDLSRALGKRTTIVELTEPDLFLVILTFTFADHNTLDPFDFSILVR